MRFIWSKRPELGRCPPSPVAAARLTPLFSRARRPELGGKPSPVPGGQAHLERSHFITSQISFVPVFVRLIQCFIDRSILL